MGSFSITVAPQPERQIAVFEPVAGPQSRASLAALAKLSEATQIAGERYGVELLPNLVARSQGEGSASTQVTRLGCVGVELDDWAESVRASRSGRSAPRSSIRLCAGRYAVIEGVGSLAALYRVWRRCFDDWLSTSGECPKPERLYVRFPTPDAGEARIALFIPLEDLPAAPVRGARAHRSGGVASPGH